MAITPSTTAWLCSLGDKVRYSAGGMSITGYVVRLFVERNNSVWAEVETIDSTGRPFSSIRPQNQLSAA